MKYVNPTHHEAQKVNGAIRAEMILRSQKMSEEKDYNGWKNHETWNVALWLQNTESYYLAMVEFMKDYKGTQPYVDFLESCGLDTQQTHDGVDYTSDTLDYKELNDMMLEFSPKGTRA